MVAGVSSQPCGDVFRTGFGGEWNWKNNHMFCMQFHKKARLHKNYGISESSEDLILTCENDFWIVKIIFYNADNGAIMLWKRLFCGTEQPLLSCKTYSFGMSNNRFCNVLITKRLGGGYICEKHLQPFSIPFTYEVGCLHWISAVSNTGFQRLHASIKRQERNG